MSDDRGDYITYREAITMFVLKADFEKFSVRIESKLDELLSNRLPRWAWVALGVLAAFVAPLIAALFAHFLTKVWP